MATIKILVGIASLLGIFLLAACLQPKEPTIEVSGATIGIYDSSCSACHADGLGGAPKAGDTEDWAARVSKGMSTVHKNAIDGFEGATGIMPARGGRDDLSDEEIVAVVDYMVNISR